MVIFVLLPTKKEIADEYELEKAGARDKQAFFSFCHSAVPVPIAVPQRVARISASRLGWIVTTCDGINAWAAEERCAGYTARKALAELHNVGAMAAPTVQGAGAFNCDFFNPPHRILPDGPAPHAIARRRGHQMP